LVNDTCEIGKRGDIRGQMHHMQEGTKDFSDEHVIPDALGGYYHIRTVCKDCNQRAGSHVDAKLVNHVLMAIIRFSKDLRGKAKSTPNPFKGTYNYKNDPDLKVKLILDSEKRLIPYILPIIPDRDSLIKNGSIQVILDKSDEGKIEDIVAKISDRLGIPREKLQCVKSEVQRKEEPVEVRLNIDMREFKIDLLKIAYEFAIDSLPEYLDDPEAERIARILHGADFAMMERENLFIGSGIDTSLLSSFQIVLRGQTDNHHNLFLLDVTSMGLICIVALFNSMCLEIRLSRREYIVDDIIIGVNDIEGKTFSKTTLTAYTHSHFTLPYVTPRYAITDERSERLYRSLMHDPAFYCLQINEKTPLFDRSGQLKYPDMASYSLELVSRGLGRECGDMMDTIITEVDFPEVLFVQIMPTRELLQIVCIRVEQNRLI